MVFAFVENAYFVRGSFALGADARLVLGVIDPRPGRQTVFVVVRRRIEPVIGHVTAYRFGLFVLVRVVVAPGAYTSRLFNRVLVAITFLFPEHRRHRVSNSSDLAGPSI